MPPTPTISFPLVGRFFAGDDLPEKTGICRHPDAHNTGGTFTPLKPPAAATSSHHAMLSAGLWSRYLIYPTKTSRMPGPQPFKGKERLCCHVLEVFKPYHLSPTSST